MGAARQNSKNDSTLDQSQRTVEFVRLLTQHEQRVYGYIVSLVPKWADADEILQETNVRLWEQYSDFKPGADFGAWACTVAYYQVLTYRKRQRREKLQFSEQFVELVGKEFATQSQWMEDRLQAMESCMQTLLPNQRKLLEACYSGTSNIKKVAEQLGRTLPGAYKTLARLRQILQVCIERRLREEGSE